MRKGWEIKKLDDICTIKGRIGYRGYTKQDLVEKGKGAISLSPSNIKDNQIVFNNCTYISWFKYNESPEIMIYDGDIIFCKTASIGKIALIENLPEKATINPQFVVLKELKCLNKYLYFFMISEEFKLQMDEIISGTAIPTLSQANLGNLNISIPPLPEQKRIVSILNEAFAAIAKAKANAEQNLKNAKELFECVLDNILYDKKWEVKELGEVCLKVEYGSSTKSTTEGKLPVLRMGNIQNGRFTWDSLVYSDNEEDNEQYLLKHNDVLFNRTNSLELVGKTAIYKSEMPAIFAGYLIRIHRKEDLLDADYLNYYLNSKMAIEYGKSVVISSVNQANINGTKLKTYPIPLPSLKTQQAIVQKLNALSAETKKLEAIYQQKLADLEELKKSILQKAFAGELKTEKLEMA